MHIEMDHFDPEAGLHSEAFTIHLSAESRVQLQALAKRHAVSEADLVARLLREALQEEGVCRPEQRL